MMTLKTLRFPSGYLSWKQHCTCLRRPRLSVSPPGIFRKVTGKIHTNKQNQNIAGHSGGRRQALCQEEGPGYWPLETPARGTPNSIPHLKVMIKGTVSHRHLKSLVTLLGRFNTGSLDLRSSSPSVVGEWNVIGGRSLWGLQFEGGFNEQ